MNAFCRRKLVAAIMILRSKNLIPPVKCVGFLLKLFNCQDKEMRKMITSHVINDVKKLNKIHKNNTINKLL